MLILLPERREINAVDLDDQYGGARGAHFIKQSGSIRRGALPLGNNVPGLRHTALGRFEAQFSAVARAWQRQQNLESTLKSILSPQVGAGGSVGGLRRNLPCGGAVR